MTDFEIPTSDEQLAGLTKAQIKRKLNLVTVDEIIAFESGELENDEEVLDFFQRLINSGLAWQLQGSYGRAAASLIERGLCKPAK